MTKGYEYAKQCVDGKKPVGKYIKKQCQIYIDTVDGRIEGSHFDERRYNRLCALMKIINNPKGVNAGEPMFDVLMGFQWLILEAIFCVVDDDNIRQYQNLVLEIARKNGKSQISGLIMIVAMLTEPKFSKLYSISVNAQLARETYDAMREFLVASPALFDAEVAASGRGKGGRFSVTANNIKCPLNETIYTPLANNGPNSLDGRLISFGIIDECGGLPNNAPIEATRSSQITLAEKLTIVISTRYPGTENPFEWERDYARKVLDGLVDDKRLFAFLYEPDDEIEAEWRTNDLVLQQANPLAVEIPMMWEALVDKRKKAIETPGSEAYFLTKNCNIMASSFGVEQFVPIEVVEECQVAKDTIDWAGRQVYVGLDLSLTSDNTAVVMVTQDNDGTIYCKPFCFVPTDRVEAKEKHERVHYKAYINSGYCEQCGSDVIDYKYIEDKILALEKEYGVEILQIAVDPWHATATCQRLQQEGLPVVLLKQHSYVLGGPTLFLKETMLQKRFKFEKNPLYVINYDNVRVMTDTNLNIYCNKKKSQGKIDMVAATVNAMYGLYLNQAADDSFGALFF